MNQPQPQVILPCVVKSVTDGDTLTVDVVIPFKVRLKDCWAPEKYEKGGFAATKYVKNVAAGKKGVIIVPLENVDSFDDIMTFGRILGDIHIDGDDESLVQQLIREGLATRERLK